ncbi:MAG: hypothetical protein JSS11_05865 [Verrucomicrobia bacterium]|nr:hypothetical protein [Verrucomicrobiota bacterium]
MNRVIGLIAALCLMGLPLRAVDNVTLSGVTYSSGSSLTIDASDTLTTSGTVTVASGANITLRAGVRIYLEPGFSVQSGATFQALVTPDAIKSTPTITWSPPTAITYGTVLSSTQLNATASVAGTFTYSPAAGATLNAGTGQTLSVVFTPTDTTNYNSVSATVALTVNKAGGTVTLGGMVAIYDGSAKAATATTSPAGLAVTFTYDAGSGPTGTAPSGIGSYTVLGTINDSNYTGAAAGTLTIFDPNLDADGDGLPNGWEIAHGLNPNDPSDAGAASAHDGTLTNLDCYKLGLDPGTTVTTGDLKLNVHQPNN